MWRRLGLEPQVPSRGPAPEGTARCPCCLTVGAVSHGVAQGPTEEALCAEAEGAVERM